MESYKTQGTCSTEIKFEIEDGKIKEVEFVRGCPGNTFGISQLIKGMDINEAIKRLKGIDCRGRGTSCPDQLSKALEAYVEKNQ